MQFVYAATQVAVAVYEVMSPFMTEMRESLAAVKTEMREGLGAVRNEMAAMKRNIRAMEGKVNHLSRDVAAQKNLTVSGLSTLGAKLASVESVKENMEVVKAQLNEHKMTVAEELEALNTIDLKLDLLDAKQDTLDVKQDRLGYKVMAATSALESRILSNTTRELRKSAENHVTLIESKLSSVNASIGNELRMVKRLLAKNDTAVCETFEVDTHPEDLLQTLLNSQSELELRVLSNITKELEMSAEYHVTAFQSTLESRLASVDAGIQNGLRKIESQIAKNCTAVGADILSSVADELDVVVNNQNTIKLHLKVLSNNTKELRKSAENHVTSIESQLTLVDAGIRSELRKIESQIANNSTGSERVELEIFSNEDVLETLVSVNTSISGQVSHINEGLEHISSSVDSVIVGLQECMVGGGQNCSRQPLEECKVNSEPNCTCETLNCSRQPVEECTCDTPVEQNCSRNLVEECKAYCDTDCPREEILSNYECGGTGGWRRVVYLNMTDPNTNCPPGWQLTSYSKRTCGRGGTCARSCDSVSFPVSGGNYTSVCGSIRAYQYGETSGFQAYHERRVTTIEGAYVSGVSLTHGSPQQHIWTFAAGLSEAYPTQTYVCPCDAPPYSISIPPFVGVDYFCESGVNSGYPREVFYPDDPLWDGEGCGSSSRCCSFNNPPYFTKPLPSPTSDPIVVRLCHYTSNEDSPVEFMELYVK